MKPHIAPSRKAASNISVVIYGSQAIDRMTSFGPRNLLKVGNTKIINHQIEVLNQTFVNPDIFICAGYELNKLLGFRLVENQLHNSTNECEDIRLAFNLLIHKSVLLINGTSLLSGSDLSCKYNTSIIYGGLGEEDITINNNEYVEHLVFNSNNDLKWKNIAFIQGNDFSLVKSLLDTKNYTHKFLFELLNSAIDMGVKFKLKEVHKIQNISSAKQLRDINETGN